MEKRKNLSEKNKLLWEKHYNRPKSRLLYPDENLVRILSKIEPPNPRAVDFGAGSGRHSKLLDEFGFEVTAIDMAEQVLEIFPEISINRLHSNDFPTNLSDLGIVVAWGVLHYNSDSKIFELIQKIHHSLATGGYFVGTLRAKNDTHLELLDGKAGLADLEGVYARTFAEPEVLELLVSFRSIQLGYMERTPIGQLNKRIAHYFFLARK